jgi:hypothetical protein
MGCKNIRAVVNKVLARKIETKSSVITAADGTQIYHNNFINLDPSASFLATNVGVADPMIGVRDRIGDEITLKGMSIRMMLELNERFSG